jgi:hypothetical protein
MLPFLGHVEGCKQCRDNPRFPCARGYELFQRAAETLVRKYDPSRAKA